MTVTTELPLLDFLTHPDPAASALLTAGWLLPDIGMPAAMIFATVACPAIDEAELQARLVEICDRLDDANMLDDNDEEATRRGYSVPRGVSLRDFANSLRDEARADARRSAEWTVTEDRAQSARNRMTAVTS